MPECIDAWPSSAAAQDPTAAGAAKAAAAGPRFRAKPSVSVVVPTLNEAQNLPHVLAELPADLHEVIVVDGRSTDATVEVARRLRPDVRIVFQTGRGKGNALIDGFNAASGDVIVMLDADGSADPAEIPRFVAALIAGADFAKGSRFARGGGSADITRLRRFGNRALGRTVNLLFGTSFTDLCYGYNAFWRRCLPALAVDCDGFEVETLMNIRAATARLAVREVPSFERPRRHGRSKLRPARDGARVMRTILRERAKRFTAAPAEAGRRATPGGSAAGESHRCEKTKDPGDGPQSRSRAGKRRYLAALCLTEAAKS